MFLKSTRFFYIVVPAIILSIVFTARAPEIQQWIYDLIRPLFRTIAPDEYASKWESRGKLLMGVFGLIVGGFVGAGYLKVLQRWERWTTGDKVNMFIALLIGIIASNPVYTLINAIGAETYRGTAMFFAFVFSVALTLITLLTLKSLGEVLPWYDAKTRAKKTGFKILDTNVIIDGRIYDVARCGFLEGTLYIPKFVLAELQYIADSADALRRQRGRRGLDVLRLLEGEFKLEVGTFDRMAPDDEEEVDSRLVRLAKSLGAQLVTNDMNLNRVAALQKVQVLNLNDLAMALKPNILPRETLKLLVAREGNQAGQGVGYLDDGTMVVVEGAKTNIGFVVDVLVTQVIQTERGKMIFGEMIGIDSETKNDSSQRTKRVPLPD